MTNIEALKKDAKRELAMLEACTLVCGACDPETCMFYNVVKYAERRMQLAAEMIEMIKKDIEHLEKPEQKHGHWVTEPDKSPKTTTINMYSFIYSCSECGKAVGHHAEYNYCPGCGAIMTRVVKQDES